MDNSSKSKNLNYISFLKNWKKSSKPWTRYKNINHK